MFDIPEEFLSKFITINQEKLLISNIRETSNSIKELIIKYNTISQLDPIQEKDIQELLDTQKQLENRTTRLEEFEKQLDVFVNINLESSKELLSAGVEQLGNGKKLLYQVENVLLSRIKFSLNNDSSLLNKCKFDITSWDSILKHFEDELKHEEGSHSTNTDDICQEQEVSLVEETVMENKENSDDRKKENTNSDDFLFTQNKNTILSSQHSQASRTTDGVGDGCSQKDKADSGSQEKGVDQMEM